MPIHVVTGLDRARTALKKLDQAASQDGAVSIQPFHEVLDNTADRSPTYHAVLEDFFKRVLAKYKE